MANSGSPSKFGAITTLLAICALIGGLAFAAFQLSKASTKANQPTPTSSAPQSPDLDNIDGQFDSL